MCTIALTVNCVTAGDTDDVEELCLMRLGVVATPTDLEYGSGDFVKSITGLALCLDRIGESNGAMDVDLIEELIFSRFGVDDRGISRDAFSSDTVKEHDMY